MQSFLITNLTQHKTDVIEKFSHLLEGWKKSKFFYHMLPILSSDLNQVTNDRFCCGESKSTLGSHSLSLRLVVATNEKVRPPVLCPVIERIREEIRGTYARKRDWEITRVGWRERQRKWACGAIEIQLNVVSMNEWERERERKEKRRERVRAREKFRIFEGEGPLRCSYVLNQIGWARSKRGKGRGREKVGERERRERKASQIESESCRWEPTAEGGKREMVTCWLEDRGLLLSLWSDYRSIVVLATSVAAAAAASGQPTLLLTRLLWRKDSVNKLFPRLLSMRGAIVSWKRLTFNGTNQY